MFAHMSKIETAARMSMGHHADMDPGNRPAGQSNIWLLPVVVAALMGAVYILA